MSKPEELVVTAFIDEIPTVIDVLDLKFSCDEHGDSAASFSVLQAGTATDGDLLDAMTRIEITDPDYESGWRWLGRVRQPGSTPWAGGQEFHYQVEGMQYACSDRIFLHTMKWTTGINVGLIMRDAGGMLCPDVFCESAGIGAEARKTRERTQEFVFSTAANVFNTVAALGDAAAPLIWEVYAGSVNFPILNTKPRPTSHAYYALMATGAIGAAPMIGGAEIDFEADVAVVRNRASIKYRNENTATGWDIWTEGGAGSLAGSVIKDYGVDLNRQFLTNNKILRETVGTILAQVGNPQNTGRQLVLPYPCTLLDIDLAPVPLWTLRPNFIIQIPDFNAGNLSLAFGGNDFYVETTTWNENTRTMTCEIGPVR